MVTDKPRAGWTASRVWQGSCNLNRAVAGATGGTRAAGCRTPPNVGGSLKTTSPRGGSRWNRQPGLGCQALPGPRAPARGCVRLCVRVEPTLCRQGRVHGRHVYHTEGLAPLPRTRCPPPSAGPGQDGQPAAGLASPRRDASPRTHVRSHRGVRSQGRARIAPPKSLLEEPRKEGLTGQELGVEASGSLFWRSRGRESPSLRDQQHRG